MVRILSIDRVGKDYGISMHALANCGGRSKRMICHEGNRLELRYIRAIDAQVSEESREDSTSEKNAAEALSAWQSHREQCQCGNYPAPRIFWRVLQGHISPTFGTRKEAFSYARQLSDEGKEAAVIPVDENGAQVVP